MFQKASGETLGGTYIYIYLYLHSKHCWGKCYLNPMCTCIGTCIYVRMYVTTFLLGSIHADDVNIPLHILEVQNF